MDNLFSTHPNVENRIAELQKLAGQMQVDRTGRRPQSRAYAESTQRNTGGAWRVPPVGRTGENQGLRGPWG
jgi:heat shock protein HtpX